MLHLPLDERNTSLIDFKFIILLIIQPHLPQTISIDGYDILIPYILRSIIKVTSISFDEYVREFFKLYDGQNLIYNSDLKADNLINNICCLF